MAIPGGERRTEPARRSGTGATDASSCGLLPVLFRPAKRAISPVAEKKMSKSSLRMRLSTAKNLYWIAANLSS